MDILLLMLDANWNNMKDIENMYVRISYDGEFYKATSINHSSVRFLEDKIIVEHDKKAKEIYDIYNNKYEEELIGRNIYYSISYEELTIAMGRAKVKHKLEGKGFIKLYSSLPKAYAYNFVKLTQRAIEVAYNTLTPRLESAFRNGKVEGLRIANSLNDNL